MLISFIFSYSESFFLVFYPSFFFVLGQGPSARNATGLPAMLGVHYPRAVGAGVRVWGPSTAPLACMSCEGCVP